MISVILTFAGVFSATTAQAASMPRQEENTSSLLALVPSSLVVEQTLTLSNGENITVFYKKEGNNCELYSEHDLSGYTINDLARLKSTGFRLVSKPKGKCVYRTSFTQAKKLIKSLVNAYL